MSPIRHRVIYGCRLSQLWFKITWKRKICPGSSGIFFVSCKAPVLYITLPLCPVIVLRRFPVIWMVLRLYSARRECGKAAEKALPGLCEAMVYSCRTTEIAHHKLLRLRRPRRSPSKLDRLNFTKNFRKTKQNG